MSGPPPVTAVRTVGRAERVTWTSLGPGRGGIACAVHTRQLGPAMAGLATLARGSSDQAVAVAMARAEQTTLAAVTAGAPVGGAAVVLLGTADAATPRDIADVLDGLDGDVVLVPELGEHADLARSAAAHTAFVADPGVDVAADGIAEVAAGAWSEITGGQGLGGVRVAVVGGRDYGVRIARAAAARGAVAVHTPWSPPLPSADVLIAATADGRTAEDTLRLDCRLLVAAVGGPMDDEAVWRAMVARGVECVPGSVALGPLLRAAAAIAAPEPARRGSRPRQG
ncbi:MAG: hypothetical protein KDC33_10540 [Thermoleophilia bacterium]|nr:hypothetical protein [Thermoleophilia bacterium]